MKLKAKGEIRRKKQKFKAKVKLKAKGGIQSKKWTVYFQFKIPLCQIGSNSLMIQLKRSKGKQETT